MADQPSALMDTLSSGMQAAEPLASGWWHAAIKNLVELWVFILVFLVLEFSWVPVLLSWYLNRYHGENMYITLFIAIF